MRYKRALLMGLIVILLVISINKYAYTEKENTVYIVVVNKLTLPDLYQMPNTQKILEDGALGLMNTRGVGSYSGAESFATINSSAKTYASSSSVQFHNLENEYLKLYQNRTGNLDEGFDIGNIGIGRMYNENASNRYKPYIGVLGDSLRRNGHKTAIFGNSDMEENLNRNSALIAMDSMGVIDYGNVDNILLPDIRYPYGYKTDYEKIIKEIKEIKDDSSLIVIETGDLNRSYNYASYLTSEYKSIQNKMILEDIDNFIGRLMRNKDKNRSLLIILSPNRGKESKLSPILLWGKDIDGGVATSSTTNREGLISNLDIAPTISKFLKTPQTNMMGNSVKSVEKYDRIAHILSIDSRINTVSKIRSKLLLIYALISIAIKLIISLMLWWNFEFNGKLGQVFKNILLILYGLPLILILNALFVNDSIFRFLLSLFIILGIYIYLIIKFDSGELINFVSLITFIIILTDLFMNGSITRFSVLSHDPTIGARYFGIGNELMGVFLTVAILSSGMVLEKFSNKFASILLLLFAIIFVAHPSLGANVGGTISIVAASVYFVLEIIEKQFNFKNVIATIFVVSIVVMGMGYIDINFSPNPTHLGKNLLLLHEKGIGVAGNIVYRKLLMGLSLLRTSIWTKVLFMSIFAQTIAAYKKKNISYDLMDTSMGKSILACIAGSIVGFLLNDSGIMLAAISMNLLTIYILFVILDGSNDYLK